MEKAIEDEKIRGAYIRQRVESIAREGRERDVGRAFCMWREATAMEKVGSMCTHDPPSPFARARRRIHAASLAYRPTLAVCADGVCRCAPHSARRERSHEPLPSGAASATLGRSSMRGGWSG